MKFHRSAIGDRSRRRPRRPQTLFNNIVLVTTRPALRMRYSSNLISQGCSSMSMPLRRTRCAMRSISKSEKLATRSQWTREAAWRQRIESGQELGEREGFGEIIITASVKPFHPISMPPRAVRNRTADVTPALRIIFTIARPLTPGSMRPTTITS